MKKPILQVLSALLAIMILLPVVPTKAVEITPFYVYTGVLYAGLSVDSSNKATATGKVVASSSSYPVSGTLSILQYKNGSWITFKSWPTVYGTGSLNLSETCTLVSDYSYKTKFSVNVNGEKLTKYSAEEST